MFSNVLKSLLSVLIVGSRDLIVFRFKFFDKATLKVALASEQLLSGYLFFFMMQGVVYTLDSLIHYGLPDGGITTLSIPRLIDYFHK